GLEPYAVIELPIADFADALADVEVSADVNRTALAEAQARIALMGAELEKLRDQRRERALDSEARETSAATMAARLVELEKELETKTTRVREVESRAGDEHVRAERLANDLHEAEKERARQRDGGTRRSKH